MPVDLDVVEQVAATTATLYEEAEQSIIALITRQLRGDDGASDWAVAQLARVGALRRAVQAVVARLDVDGSASVRRAVATAWRSGSQTAITDLTQELTPKAFTEAMKRAAQRRGDATMQALADAVVREIRPAHSAILPSAESAFRRVVAAATARSVGGVQTRRRAAQDAWTALVDQGITSFPTRDGRRLRLHTYVEMATRTAALRAATVASVDEWTAAGQRLAYVEDRAGECEICRPWEHSILALSGEAGEQQVFSVTRNRRVLVQVKATLAEALAAGLQHPNCRHRLRLFVAGSTRLARATADPAGDLARQRQRQIERNLRFWREREMAAFMPQDKARARARAQAWDEQMAAHVATTGVPRMRWRERPGAGHVPAARRRELTSV